MLLSLSMALVACGVSSPTPAQDAFSGDSKLRALRCVPDEPCEPPPPDEPPPPPPPPPTGQNLRVIVTLAVVNAKDTEDVAGGFLGLGTPVDEFYTMGGVQISPATSNVGVRKGFVTPVINAKKGSTYYPSQKIFEAVIAPDSRLVVESFGFDEDLGKDAPTMAAVSAVVGVGVAAATLAGGCAATAFVGCGVAAAVFAAASPLMRLDEDDKLGISSIDMGILRQNQFGTYSYRTHLGDCDGFYSSCDYEITHIVRVIPTDDLLTPLN